ncbi:MAG: hypothetical protein ACM33T_15635 [Solirubrobacterales bacterium]
MNAGSTLVAAGVVVLAAAGLFAASAVLAGTAAWVGAELPLPLPPQTLVVAGLFLAVPVAMVGWGMLWLGHWLKANR